MREFVYLCDEGFSAIVKLTMVKYILPKLRNRWSDDELRKQAESRPTKFYQDVHGRAVRGEITGQELAAARATIDELLDQLERTLAPGPWIVGSQFSLAEISVAPYMFRLAALGADQFWSSQRRPRVNTWYRNLAARPAFKTAVSWPDRVGRRLRGGRPWREGPLGPSVLAPLSGSNREARKLYLLSSLFRDYELPPSI